MFVLKSKYKELKEIHSRIFSQLDAKELFEQICWPIEIYLSNIKQLNCLKLSN